MDLSFNGQTIYASTGGRDFDRTLPTVVMLHGAGMDHTVWQFQARAFAYHGYGVLSLDLPGHGHSDGPPPTTIAGYADAVAGMLDELGVDCAHIGGHSMGAFAGIDLASRYQGKASSLALMGVAATMPVHPDLLAAAEKNDHLAFDFVSSWSHARDAHTGGHPTPGLWMMGSTMRLLERSGPGVLASGLEACNAYDVAIERASELTVPVLLLMGQQDLMTRPAATEPLAQAISNATTIIVPKTGHMAMIEQPDVVINELTRFWQRSNAGGT